jgi:hypothetical protein
MTADCKRSIDDYLGRDFGTGRGLPASCALPDVLSWYPFNEGEGVARFGELQVEYRFRSLSLPEFLEPILFYFDAGLLRRISTDFWSSEPKACEQVLHLFGPPQYRLDAYFREARLADSDWLYLDLGVALCVHPETHLITRFDAYPPCPLQVYRDQYRPIELMREFSERH